MVDLEMNPPSDEVPVDSFMRLHKSTYMYIPCVAQEGTGDLQRMIVSNLMLLGWQLCRIRQCID